MTIQLSDHFTYKKLIKYVLPSIFMMIFTSLHSIVDGFFTSLNNGLISALISFLRTLVFQIATILILPILFGLNGIWYAMVVADLLACLVTIFFLFKMRKKYRY